MAESTQNMSEKALTRRSVIKRGVAGMALAAAALAAVTLATANTSKAAGGGRRLSIKVENAVLTSGPGSSVSVDNFIVVGDITMVDGKPASGKFFCKGVLFPTSVLDGGTPDPDAVTYVDQRFRIDGEGSILGAGTEVDGQAAIQDDLAVVGGTGRWVGAAGTYTAVAGGPIPFTQDGTILFEFRIRRGSGDD
ncbi:MAG TPA: hypothetical protein VEG60_00300 [Candidatus Binatia bacterium]|nr:hypothetical protein [Candidatus Binatia bacterium]